MAMRLRLSNGRSFAVEFEASNEQAFRHNLRRAALDFFAHEGKGRSAELHVADDFGEWLSANYPHSNASYLVTFGQVDRAEWATAKMSNERGTWFVYELRVLSDFVTD